MVALSSSVGFVKMKFDYSRIEERKGREREQPTSSFAELRTVVSGHHLGTKLFTCSSSSLLAAGSFSQYLALSLRWLALSRALSPSSPSSSLPPFYRPFTCEVWGRSP
ncbi:unnamed protein product [Prunus brigantina]